MNQKYAKISASKINAYEYYNDLIVVTAAIENAVSKVISNRVNNKKYVQSEFTRKKYEDWDENIKSYLWRRDRLLGFFENVFDDTVPAKAAHIELTIKRIKSKTSVFQAINSLVDKRNEYAHTASTKIDVNALLNGLYFYAHILDFIDANILN